MSLIKNLAKAFYNFAFTPAEQQAERLNGLTEVNRCAVATGFLARDAALLDKSSLEYRKLLQLSEDLVVKHNRATSFIQLCRSHVRRNSGETYYVAAAVGRLLENYLPYSKAEVKGGEYSSLVDSIRADLEAAKAEKNPIKKRSIVRNAIKAEVENLAGDDLEFVVQALLVTRK